MSYYFKHNLSLLICNRKSSFGDRFCLLLMLVSQVLLVLVPFYERINYLCVGFLFVVVVLNISIVEIRSLVFALLLFGFLAFGCCCSNIIGIEQDHIILSFAIAISCYSFNAVVECRSSILTAKGLKNVSLVCVIVGLIACAYNLGAILPNISKMTLTAFAHNYATQSFYSGKNMFAFVLYFSTISAVLLYIKSHKTIYIVAVSAFLFNIVFTLSRAVMLAVAVFFICLVFLVFKNNKKKQEIILLAICVLVLISAIAIINLLPYFVHYIIKPEYGDSSRMLIWRRAFEVFSRSPLFGLGPASAETILHEAIYEYVTSYHNTIVEVLMSGGLFALLVYIYFYVQIFFSIRKIKRFDKGFYCIYMAGFFSFIVYSLFESSFLFSADVRGIIITLFMFAIPRLYENGFMLKEKQRIH